MLLELARPAALLLCILSLYAVFHTAFLVPATGLEQTIWNSLQLLAVAAGISLVGGLIFQEPPSGAKVAPMPGERLNGTRLIATLPMQLFCWTSITILVLFIAAWYLGSQCPFDCRDPRF
jgi:hypothetical protein